MSEPTATEGFDIEWYEDPRWTLAGEGDRDRPCRGTSRARCPGRVVASMRRANSRIPGGVDYFYCADHLYGRKIIDGKILTYRWIASTTAADAAS